MEQIDTVLLAQIRLASKRLKGAARRSWFAWACRSYAGSSPRAAETIFGWNRKAVARGLSELDSGMVDARKKTANSNSSGRPRVEAVTPELLPVVDHRRST